MEAIVYLFDFVKPFLWAGAKLIGLSIVAGAVSNLAFRLMGALKRRLILLTGVIGVPFHELSHALVAMAFGMPVREIRFFQPDPQSPQLGYVNFSYSPTRVRHRVGLFFVGIAPLIAGAAVVALLLELAGSDLSFSTGLPALSEFPQALLATHEMLMGRLTGGIGPAVLALVATAVALHAAPSWADLKHAGVGLTTGITLLLILILPVIAMLSEHSSLGPRLDAAFRWAEGAITQTGLLMLWAGLILGGLFLPVRILTWLFTRDTGVARGK